MEETVQINVCIEPQDCVANTLSESAKILKMGKQFKKKFETGFRNNSSSDGGETLLTSGNSVVINMLPDEVLAYIFSFLSIKERIQNERVCQRWRWIGKDLPWTWPTKLSLNLKQLRLTDGSLTAILSRCGRGLRALELKRSCGITVRSGVSRKATEIVAVHCPNLVDINFVGIGLPNFCLKILGEGCTKLKTVRFHESRGLCETGLSDFLKHCSTLESLDIADTISGRCLGSVGSKLRVLRLTCPTLESIALDSIMGCCENLQELQLASNYLDEATLRRALLKYKTTLTTLHLDSYTALRPVDWRNSVIVLENLVTLSLNCCSFVDDELLKTLAQKYTKLKQLSIQRTNITDRGLSYLKEAPCLKIIDLSFNEEIFGRGIEQLAVRGLLEEVYAGDVPSLDTSFIPLATLCPNIRVLDVGRNYQRITNKLVDAFCIGIRRGFLKGPVKLLIGLTSVTRDAARCQGLELDYMPSPPRPIIGTQGTQMLQMPL